MAAVVLVIPEAIPPASRVLLFTSKLGLRRLRSAAVVIRRPTRTERKFSGRKTRSATPAAVPTAWAPVIRKKPVVSMERHSRTLMITVIGRARNRGVTGTACGKSRAMAGTATKA
jgi:hypothetical protein